MNNFGHSHKTQSQSGIATFLTEQVGQALAGQRLETHRKLVKNLAAELNIGVLDCASALAYLLEKYQLLGLDSSNSQTRMLTEHSKQPARPLFKFVRYRLDVGFKNEVSPDLLKKVLVEESGVDIRNITNIRIHDFYTLIDLPDEMPQEIFQHLKTFEINHRKLDIKRIKPKRKKSGNKFGRRHPGYKNLDPVPKTGV